MMNRHRQNTHTHTIIKKLKIIIKKNKTTTNARYRVWRDSLAVKNISCSSREEGSAPITHTMVYNHISFRPRRSNTLFWRQWILNTWTQVASTHKWDGQKKIKKKKKKAKKGHPGAIQVWSSGADLCSQLSVDAEEWPAWRIKSSRSFSAAIYTMTLRPPWTTRDLVLWNKTKPKTKSTVHP